MNPYNRLFIGLTLLIAGCGITGWLIGAPAIAGAALVINTFFLAVVVAGSDHHDRECHREDIR